MGHQRTRRETGVSSALKLNSACPFLMLKGELLRLFDKSLRILPTNRKVDGSLLILHA